MFTDFVFCGRYLEGDWSKIGWLCSSLPPNVGETAAGQDQTRESIGADMVDNSSSTTITTEPQMTQQNNVQPTDILLTINTWSFLVAVIFTQNIQESVSYLLCCWISSKCWIFDDLSRTRLFHRGICRTQEVCITCHLQITYISISVDKKQFSKFKFEICWGSFFLIFFISSSYLFLKTPKPLTHWSRICWTDFVHLSTMYDYLTMHGDYSFIDHAKLCPADQNTSIPECLAYMKTQSCPYQSRPQCLYKIVPRLNWSVDWCKMYVLQPLSSYHWAMLLPV